MYKNIQSFLPQIGLQKVDMVFEIDFKINKKYVDLQFLPRFCPLPATFLFFDLIFAFG